MARIYHKWSDFDDEYGDATPSFRVIHSGKFSSAYLYYFLREWLIEHDWTSRKEPEFGERYYEHRETTGGDEVWIRWEFEKESMENLPGDMNFKYHVDIIMHIMGMKDVEQVVEGKRKKIQQGEIEIDVRPRYLFKTDWGKGWLNWIKPYFWKRFYLEKKDDVEGALISEMEEFNQVILTYFELVKGKQPEHEYHYLRKTEGK